MLQVVPEMPSSHWPGVAEEQAQAGEGQVEQVWQAQEEEGAAAGSVAAAAAAEFLADGTVLLGGLEERESSRQPAEPVLVAGMQGNSHPLA